MIPETREVRLSRKDRKVLEGCCRSPLTLQRDLKRARIVLLAADGRSTRSIAKEVGFQPRIVSLWQHRYADLGLEGLQDKPLPGKQPNYTKTTDKRILKLLDKPPLHGFARWTGPLLTEALDDVDVQYVWRFLRSHKIDLAARKSWCESNDPNFTAESADCRRPLRRHAGEGHCAMRGREALDPGFEASAGSSEVAQWPRLDRREPRLQAAWHHNTVCGTLSRHREDHRNAFKTPSPRRVSRFHEQPHRGLSEPPASRHPRQPQHPQEERGLA
jgi:transposase